MVGFLTSQQDTYCLAVCFLPPMCCTSMCVFCYLWVVVFCLGVFSPGLLRTVTPTEEKRNIAKCCIYSFMCESMRAQRGIACTKSRKKNTLIMVLRFFSIFIISATLDKYTTPTSEKKIKSYTSPPFSPPSPAKELAGPVGLPGAVAIPCCASPDAAGPPLVSIPSPTPASIPPPAPPLRCADP